MTARFLPQTFLPSFLLIAVLMPVSCGRPASREAPEITQAPRTVDRIVLANGGTIQGQIVEETAEMVRIDWQGGIVGFHRDEIESIERGTRAEQGISQQDDLLLPAFESQEAEETLRPEGARHSVVMKNGERVWGQIASKAGGALTVKQTLEEGGAIVMELELDKVEKIELWPLRKDETARERLADFMKQYPGLRLVQKGRYNVLTSEMDPIDFRLFMRSLNQIYDDTLLHFFGLIDPEREPDPLDAVIFGTKQEFQSVLADVGYNAKSTPIGFYHFDTRKLVLFNAKSEEGYLAGVSQTQAAQAEMDRLIASADSAPKSIEVSRALGQIERAKEEAQRQELKLSAEARARTVHVIRHEGAHQLFHLLGLTPTGIYQGGWLIEGLAVYCETDPLGEMNQEKLMQLRYELETGELMPLEYLINFGRGTDLHKLDPLYANLAYAESWAFIYFLMYHGYQEAFFGFLKEMRAQGEDYDREGERALLEKHLGKSIKEIDQELLTLIKEWAAGYVDEELYEDFRFRLAASYGAK